MSLNKFLVNITKQKYTTTFLSTKTFNFKNSMCNSFWHKYSCLPSNYKNLKTISLIYNVFTVLFKNCPTVVFNYDEFFIMLKNKFHTEK